MTNNVQIRSNGGKPVCTVFNELDGTTSLSVSSRDAITTTPRTFFFRDPNGNVAMNVDVSVSGTPDQIYDGESSFWTPTATVGTWDFASASPVHTGSFATDATATVNGDQGTFTRSTPIDTDNFSAISGWVQLDQFDPTKNEITIEFELSGSPVGIPVNIGDFIDDTLIGSFQQFVIPFSQISLSGDVDSMIVTTVRTAGQPPDYHLDDLQLEEFGGAVYSISPGDQEMFSFNEIGFIVEDTFDSTVSNASMENIPLDGFLGLPALTAGISLTYSKNGAVTSFNFRELRDVFSSGFKKDSSGGNASKTWVQCSFELGSFAQLDILEGDRLFLTITEDLSGLDTLIFTAKGRVVN